MCARLRDYSVAAALSRNLPTYCGRRPLLNILRVLVFLEKEVSDELDGVGGALLGHGGQRLRKNVAQRIL